MLHCHYGKYNCGDKLRPGYFEEIATGNPIKFFTENMVWERTTSPVSQHQIFHNKEIIVATESGSQYYIILD